MSNDLFRTSQFCAYFNCVQTNSKIVVSNTGDVSVASSVRNLDYDEYTEFFVVEPKGNSRFLLRSPWGGYLTARDGVIHANCLQDQVDKWSTWVASVERVNGQFANGFACAAFEGRPKYLTYQPSPNYDGDFIIDWGERKHQSEAAVPTRCQAFRVTLANVEVALLNTKRRYLTAEGNRGRTVSVNRTAADAWEKWAVIPDCREGAMAKIALRSAHGCYLSAQPDGEIKADRDRVQDWEWFHTFLGGVGICLRTAHEKYVWCSLSEDYVSSRQSPGSFDNISFYVRATDSVCARTGRNLIGCIGRH